MFKQMFANLKSKIEFEELPKLEHQCKLTNPQEPEPKFKFAFNWSGQYIHTRLNSAGPHEFATLNYNRS